MEQCSFFFTWPVLIVHRNMNNVLISNYIYSKQLFKLHNFSDKIVSENLIVSVSYHALCCLSCLCALTTVHALDVT